MKKIFIFLTLLCILLSLGFIIKYNQEAEIWKSRISEIFKETFKEAILIEMDKRKEIKIYRFHATASNNQEQTSPTADTITIISEEYGRQSYPINDKKRNNQLLKGNFDNSLSSYLLHKYPLSADTIKYNWDNLLVKKGIKSNTIIRYTYTNLLGETNTTHSKNKFSTSECDSVDIWKIGYRQEAEVVGFALPKSYWEHQTCTFWIWLILPWSGLTILFLLYRIKAEWVKRKFLHREIIHVADAKLEKSKIYLLNENVKFDTLNRSLTNDNATYKLTPQSVVLLTLFIRATEHKLSTEEISKEMWHGNASKEQIYTAIRRLRKELTKASNHIHIDNLNGIYYLKASISSNKLV
ncbi:MAG: winged helix-turn-helix domain-containing protein [Bacteroides sp.]|nr:winged helix-turn-helix domain-containing protein [Bacteroides sp.]